MFWLIEQGIPRGGDREAAVLRYLSRHELNDVADEQLEALYRREDAKDIRQKMRDARQEIYGELSVIDSKSSSLGQTAAFLLTIAALVYNKIIDRELDAAQNWLLLLSVILPAIAMLLRTMVVWLRWHDPNVSDRETPRAHLGTWLEVRDSRTRRYRWAWLLTIVSIPVVLFCLLRSQLFLAGAG